MLENYIILTARSELEWGFYTGLYTESQSFVCLINRQRTVEET